MPAPPSDLPDLAAAADRLYRAVTRGEKIAVWGDFDADGQTATTLLVSLLRDLRADVTYYIPHRLTESHGIKIDPLKRLLDQRINVLLTCDTGIAEHEAIAFAKSQDVTVLVTDHHDLPDELPDADALINPKRLPSTHPLRSLPGVGVAFKLAQQVWQLAGESDRADDYLDLVALGIVADVAELTADTRYLLQRGLDRLRRTQRLGLQAVLDARQDRRRESLGRAHRLWAGAAPQCAGAPRRCQPRGRVVDDDQSHARSHSGFATGRPEQ